MTYPKCGVEMSKSQTRRVGLTGFSRLLRTWRNPKKPAMHDISVLQGLLNFAGGFVAGKAFKPILHFVQQIVRSRDFSALRRLHGYVKEVVKVSAPRWIRAKTQHANVVIYTDGAWLPDKGVEGATWGGVLLDNLGGHRIIHNGTVPSQMVRSWQAIAGEQIICQIEMYAALLVRFRYRDLHLNRPCIFFIDNEAARISLLKGASPWISLFRMTHAVCQCFGCRKAVWSLVRTCTFLFEHQ